MSFVWSTMQNCILVYLLCVCQHGVVGWFEAVILCDEGQDIRVTRIDYGPYEVIHLVQTLDERSR